MTESQNRMNDVPETNVQRNHRILAQIISQINQCVNDNSIFRTEVDVLNTLGVRTKEGDQIKVCRTGLYKINGFKSIWFPNFIENREHWTNTLSSDNNEIIEWEYNNHPNNNWRERKNRLNSAQQYLEKYPQEEAPLRVKQYILFSVDLIMDLDTWDYMKLWNVTSLIRLSKLFGSELIQANGYSSKDCWM